MAFIIRHWELCLAFVVILAYWLKLELQEQHGAHSLLPQDVVTALNRHQAIICDLRPKELFQQGRIRSAQSFPGESLLTQLDKFKRHQKKRIILVDDNGQSVGKMRKALLKNNFEQVFYLKNGMQAWLQAKLPVQKEE